MICILWLLAILLSIKSVDPGVVVYSMTRCGNSTNMTSYKNLEDIVVSKSLANVMHVHIINMAIIYLGLDVYRCLLN